MHSPEFWHGLSNAGIEFSKLAPSQVIATLTGNPGNLTLSAESPATPVPPPPTQFSITSSAGANGSVTPNGVTVVVAGDSLLFTASPAVGYEIGQWTTDEAVAQTGGTTFLLENIQAAHTVVVTFSALPPTPIVTTTPSTATFQWTDKNGTQTGDMAAFNSTVDVPSLTLLDFMSTTATSVLCSLSAVNTCLFGSCLSLATVSFPNLTSIVGLSLIGCPALVTVDFPLLGTVTGNIVCHNNSTLSGLSFPALASVSGNLQVYSCPTLQSVNIPEVTTIGKLQIHNNNALVTVNTSNFTTTSNDVSAYTNPSLTTFSFPLFTNTGGKFVTAFGCAFSAASVNSILHACLIGGMTSGEIDLSEGTSAAPTGQGILDKATLVSNGVSVYTN